MSDNKMLMRPLFRILYGIVSILFIWGIYIDINFFSIIWNNKDKLHSLSEYLTFLFLIGLPFLFIWCAYKTFIIALRGKAPNSR